MFRPNLNKGGRIARGVLALIIFAVSFHYESRLGFIIGLFVLLEALRGWCAFKSLLKKLS